MGTTRHHIRIDAPPAKVWAAIGDAAAIADWFPAVASASVSGSNRHIDLADGGHLEEEIVTNDGDLRRFQYRITGGTMPVDTHLGTVDVIDLDGASLVVYSTDVTPDEMAAGLGPALEDALRGLADHVTGTRGA